ncbi:MAG: DUF1104 domain-containing protein [Sulfurovum sp.]|nr:DUF1104 domain-containing protein [Sulfurovum sp.]
MKKFILIAGLLTATMFAADFSKISLEDLNKMRDQVTAEDKADYIAEIKKRMQEMAPEEKAKYEITKELMEAEKEAVQPIPTS